MGLLDGKVVLVTGAGGGIGRAHALACAREGACVVVNDLGGARDGTGGGGTMADGVVAEIRALGGDAVANHDSVTDEAGCARMVDAARERWGRLDGVVNNAGILRDRTFSKMSRDDWEAVLAVHLGGTRNVCAAALDALSANGGAIVNTSSVSGLVGNFGQSNYAAAKAGIYGLSRVLALELRRKGVRVNCIAPVAKTRMTEELELVPDDLRPEHVAPVVVYLLSDLARDVTGKVFGVAGQRIHVYEVHVNAGVDKPGPEPWTAAEIHDRLADIERFEGVQRSLVGKRYDGGAHVLDREAFRAYADATDDANPAYRGADGVAPPMFHVRPLIGLLEKMAGDTELGLDRLRLVHGEHAMRFARPLRHGDVLKLSSTLTGLEDKPSGRVATFSITGTVGGEVAFGGTTTFFVRAKAKGGGGAKKPAEPARAPPPPTWTAEQVVALDQAVRYAEASGDRNPIHLDDAVARKAGLPGVILHGLCTMAFAARDVVDRACGGDPGRLASLSVRWAKPVFPGQRLVLQAWDAGDGTLALATVDEKGEPVVVNARAEVRP